MKHFKKLEEMTCYLPSTEMRPGQVDVLIYYQFVITSLNKLTDIV